MKRILGLSVGVLLAAAFLLSPPAASTSMNRPTWSAGDYWVYSLPSGTVGLSANATMRMDVTGTESVNVNGTSYSSYHLETTVTIPYGSLTFTVPADIWFSVDTLAIVKIVAVVNISLGGPSLESTFTISGNPPQTINWPLTTGSRWSSTTTVTVVTDTSGSIEGSSVPLTTDFLVEADTTITVPAGTFVTTPLKETDAANGTYTVNYWSADVGNWARVGMYSSSGQEEGGFNLTAYRYQGGGLLNISVLGIPLFIWLIVLAVVIVAAVALVVLRRRKPPMPLQMPPGQAMPPAGPQTPPEGPPGTPPTSPP